MAIEEIDRLKCKNCGLCFDVCPMDVFRKIGIYVYIAYRDDCMSCHLCEDVCPEDALFVSARQATEVIMPF